MQQRKLSKGKIIFLSILSLLLIPCLSLSIIAINDYIKDKSKKRERNYTEILELKSTDGYSSTISKTPYISENDYDNSMNTIVNPYIESLKNEGYFGDMNMHYEYYNVEGATDSIVLIHGLSETTEKYYELIYYFLNNNYNVYMAEWRGHGNSGRFFDDNLSKVHVDKWENFIRDLDMFITDIVNPNRKSVFGDKKNNLIMYAHSTGGAIGTIYAGQHPDVFDAVVLSSPLLEFVLPCPDYIINGIVDTLSFFGQGNEYAPGRTDFIPEVDLDGSGSSSINRVTYYTNLRINDKYQQLFGFTNHFMSEALAMLETAASESTISNITSPVAIYTANNDNLVTSDGHDIFSGYCNSETHYTVENSKHEIYMERDTIMFPYLDSVFKFLNDNSSR